MSNSINGEQWLLLRRNGLSCKPDVLVIQTIREGQMSNFFSFPFSVAVFEHSSIRLHKQIAMTIFM